MNLVRKDYLYASFLIIVSCIFVFDLFSYVGRPANFDANFHISNIAQFYTVLKDGDFPVVWSDGFANYGLPIPIVSHQLTNYLGAGLMFLTQDPTLSFNILIFIGIVLANLFYFLFLRIYFQPHIAFIAAVIFNFSAYRIINLYIRGAVPELFSQIFPPLIFIGTYFLVKKKKLSAFFLLCISFFLLALNHPMMFVIYSFLFFPYLIFLLLDEDKRSRITFTSLFLLSIVLGVGAASYYLLPLVIEIKYFYYGSAVSSIAANSYLSFSNFFNQNWQYFTQQDIFTRGHIIMVGLLETLAIILGLGYIVGKFIKKTKMVSIVDFAIVTGLLILFFTSQLSSLFYTYISVLSGIQFPWRMLSAFIFLPPIIYAFFLKDVSRYIILLIIFLIAVISFPQLYGKNYSNIPQQNYFFSTVNAHSVLMNTIWSGKSEDYPVKREKVEILDGKGAIQSKQLKNSSRVYRIKAETPLRMIDYTFYFPGWHVYVDGQEQPIEFQDPKYRGIITYLVPAGEHEVLVQFEDTKVRFLAKIVSLGFIGIIMLLFLVRKKLTKLVGYNVKR